MVKGCRSPPEIDFQLAHTHPALAPSLPCGRLAGCAIGSEPEALSAQLCLSASQSAFSLHCLALWGLGEAGEGLGVGGWVVKGGKGGRLEEAGSCLLVEFCLRLGGETESPGLHSGHALGGGVGSFLLTG